MLPDAISLARGISFVIGRFYFAYYIITPLRQKKNAQGENIQLWLKNFIALSPRFFVSMQIYLLLVMFELE